MKKTMPSVASAAIFSLPEVLDLKAAAPLLANLLDLRGSKLDIDASRVQRLGGQCLQVLLSAKATWRADNLPFQFINSSSEFIESQRLFGASDQIQKQDIH